MSAIYKTPLELDFETLRSPIDTVNDLPTLKNRFELLMKYDLHLHTSFSFDGESSIDEVAEAAIAAGLRGIAITDHCDIDGVLDEIYPPYLPGELRTAIYEAKRRYGGRLEILHGIELGQPHACPGKARILLSKFDYDFVIGSLHNLKGYPDFYFLKFDRMEERQLDYIIRRMFNELQKIVKFEWQYNAHTRRHVDTLAHVTYISRYLKECGVELDLMSYEAEWRELFKAMVESGVALEINTSNLRKGGELMPSLGLIRLYIDCGGYRFTLGSDAHKACDVAADFDTFAKTVELI